MPHGFWGLRPLGSEILGLDLWVRASWVLIFKRIGIETVLQELLRLQGAFGLCQGVTRFRITKLLGVFASCTSTVATARRELKLGRLACAMLFAA